MVQPIIWGGQAEVAHEVDVDDVVFVLAQHLFEPSSGLLPVLRGQLDDGLVEHAVGVDVLGEVGHQVHEFFLDHLRFCHGAVMAELDGWSGPDHLGAYLALAFGVSGSHSLLPCLWNSLFLDAPGLLPGRQSRSRLVGVYPWVWDPAFAGETFVAGGFRCWTFSGWLTFFGLMLALLVSLGCEYIDTGDAEEKILTPPSVRQIMDDADELGLRPLGLLERRRNAAIEDLEDLYQDRKDDAPTDRAFERLDRQLDRATDRLNNNYDQRKDRLKARSGFSGAGVW